MPKAFPFLLVALAACTPAFTSSVPSPSVSGSDIGVLVMAHGGSEEWNGHVARAVAPLTNSVPTVVAFGMADRMTLSAALDSLRGRGVRRVAVVRMFLSGESFLDQTNYYLGISETPPRSFMLMGPASTDPAARTPIRHGMTLATHVDGLLISPEARSISLERALSLSSNSAHESVLLIAHGMADEEENDRVLAAMQSAAAAIESRGFAHVRSVTLREDWPEQRAAAEDDIRRFVGQEREAGRRVIVVPMRLAGFGPYAGVLAGLEYDATDGLLPHQAVADWMRNTATSVTCSAGWGPLFGTCAHSAAEPPARSW